MVIGLKTVKGTKQLRLDPTIYDSLQKEKVAPGDVIYIESNSGAVKRVGRCDAFATEFDLEAEEYVPLPKVGGRGRSGGQRMAGWAQAWVGRVHAAAVRKDGRADSMYDRSVHDGHVLLHVLLHLCVAQGRWQRVRHGALCCI